MIYTATHTSIPYTRTCIFPNNRIAVVQVSGATSLEDALASVRLAWYPYQYNVQSGDPTNGYAEPFSLQMDRSERKTWRA